MVNAEQGVVFKFPTPYPQPQNGRLPTSSTITATIYIGGAPTPAEFNRSFEYLIVVYTFQLILFHIYRFLEFEI